MAVARRLLASSLFAAALGATPRLHAQQALPCQQLGSVAGAALPQLGGNDVALVVGDHYWSCPCGQSRRLVGDSESRALVGDGEHRSLVGDSEHRALVGDTEQRRLVGDGEQRRLVGDGENRAIVGDSEQRRLVGDTEQRRLVGDAGGLQCRAVPQCGGFAVLGTDAAVQMVTRGGLRPVSASCVPAY